MKWRSIKVCAINVKYLSLNYNLAIPYASHAVKILLKIYLNKILIFSKNITF